MKWWLCFCKQPLGLRKILAPKYCMAYPPFWWVLLFQRIIDNLFDLEQYNKIMEQLIHLEKNKKYLELKFAILKLIREFFSQENFTEIEVPLLVRFPGQEPNLSPMLVKIKNERDQEFVGYLHTSPEYTMKKMLATGWEKIFYLGKCFRDQESFGGLHNPEFTMLEFYRINEDMFKLMEDVDNLFVYLSEKLTCLPAKWGNWEIKKFGNFERVEMRDLWQKYVEVNLDDYLETNKMFELCVEQSFNPSKDESYEELFYRIFLNKIEPNLKEPIIVYHYPALMAALAKLSDKDSRYAERFEVYLGGVELANAFSELTDTDEQLRRLKEEKEKRKEHGKNVFDIDTEFIEALKTMPKSTGIALGVDRLIMALGGLQEIDDVITLPMSKIFN